MMFCYRYLVIFFAVTSQTFKKIPYCNFFFLHSSVSISGGEIFIRGIAGSLCIANYLPKSLYQFVS